MRNREGLVAASLLLLAGCGGGDSAPPPPPPPPANRAPAITSPARAEAPENGAGVVYQASATDPEGTAVSFRIAGADAARFSITSTGALSFVAPPDFEAPGDAGADNAYSLSLIASDGTLETTLELVVAVTNVADLPALRRLNGYLRPVKVSPVPGSGDVFVAEKGGRVFRTDPSDSGPGTLYLSLAGPSDGEIIVRSIVAAPDYATSGALYAYVATGAGNLELRRYGRLASGLGDPASADVLLRLQPRSVQSEILGGGLEFGPDGNLYLGIGTGRDRSEPRRLVAVDAIAQDRTSLFGKILRIDVSGDAFPDDPNRDYRIPADNPFSADAREIYAYGLENPRTMHFEGSSLLVGDAHAPDSTNSTPFPQEILLIRREDAGANFGYPRDDRGDAPDVTRPVIRYPGSRLSNSGSITAGFVYRGPVQSLVGQYLFAEPGSEAIWSVPASAILQGSVLTPDRFVDRRPILATGDTFAGVTSFGFDANRNLYLIYQNSVVYRLDAR